MNHTFSITETFSFGWESFKKNPWFFVGVTFVLLVFSMIVNALTSGSGGLAGLIGFVISLAASTVVTIAYARLALLAEANPLGIDWNQLWAPEHFWRVLGGMVLQGVIVLIGLVLLIIPGIIASLLLMFTQLMIIDRSLGPVDAIKESYHLAKKHLFQLFLFALCITLLNLVGLILVGVGLLVTLPISLIAVAHVYRKLAALNGVPVVVSEPSQPQSTPPPSAAE